MKAFWLMFSVVMAGGLAAMALPANSFANVWQSPDRIAWQPGFQIEVLVNGRRLQEYHARGRVYIEALNGAEYEVRVHNPLPDRVAVALSVDGLNTKLRTTCRRS